jgi:hypothetical protein
LKLDPTRISGERITSLYNDRKKNYLLYKGDTVAIVNEFTRRICNRALIVKQQWDITIEAGW